MTAKNSDPAIFERRYIPEPNSGCWLWTAYSPNGRYGALHWQGSRKLAHVFAYELYKGPLAAGQVVDHLCRNTFCVNPDHLESVTQLVNMRRSREAVKQQCAHGHFYAEGFEYYYRKHAYPVATHKR